MQNINTTSTDTRDDLGSCRGARNSERMGPQRRRPALRLPLPVFAFFAAGWPLTATFRTLLHESRRKLRLSAPEGKTCFVLFPQRNT